MGILDTANSAIAVVKTVNDAQIKSDLYDKIIELQNICLEMQQSRDEAIRQKSELEEKIKQRNKLKLHGDAYMLTDDLGERPICPHCYEKNGYPIRLTGRSRDGKAICENCKTWFADIFEPQPREDNHGSYPGWLD